MAADDARRAYASNDDLRDAMRRLSASDGACAGISRVVSLGRSTNGEDVRALTIGRGAHASDGDDGRGGLRFGFIGNMHGDEPVGREIAMEVGRWVCERATTTRETTSEAETRERALAKRLVNEATLFVVPTVNPDGFAAKTRGNARGVDLNRNFPYTRFSLPKSLSGRASAVGGSAGDNAKREIETALIMRWSEKWAMNGVLNYHEGALVANYPWDGNDDGSTSYSAAPDDATFRYLASSYAQAHPTMSKSAEFEGGITNGAAWYPLWGGMQDWHYVQTGTYSLTVEVDDEKWPSEDKLGAIVDEHVNASIDVCARALFGSVRGFVRDERGAAVVGASIVVGRDSAPVKTDARGFFAKPSEPSTRPVRVVITPPSNKRNVDTITHFVPTIDPTDGASIDVVFTPRSAPPGFLLLRVVAVVVFAVVAFLIRRSARRRRRVSVLSESLVNNVDVEKAIANRRGMTSSRSLSGL